MKKILVLMALFISSYSSANFTDEYQLSCTDKSITSPAFRAVFLNWLQLVSTPHKIFVPTEVEVYMPNLRSGSNRMYQGFCAPKNYGVANWQYVDIVCEFKNPRSPLKLVGLSIPLPTFSPPQLNPLALTTAYVYMNSSLHDPNSGTQSFNPFSLKDCEVSK